MAAEAEDKDKIQRTIETERTQLIGLIGDQDSVIGFLLGGIGEKTMKPSLVLQESETNVFVVHKETTSEEIEESLRTMLRRTDIGVIMITRLVADRMRQILANRDQVYPIVLEIPSPLDPFVMEDNEESKQCNKLLHNLPVKKKN